MDVYYPMSTTDRHNEIINTLIYDIFPLKKRKELSVLSELCPLVYWGTKTIPGGFELVDVKDIDDVDEFIEAAIYELDFVQPDFMLFKNNPYLKNKRQTRTAGQPDLIVEIFSKSNSKNDRAFLQNLYATSPVTEHWHIEQDSNDIKCYLGRESLPGQSLTNVLVTRQGLEFDLRYLALE